MPRTFVQAIEEILERSPNLKRATALQRACELWPELFEDYRTERLEKASAKLPLEQRRAPAVQKFEKVVDALQRDHGTSRFEALKRAAREINPVDFKRYRYALGAHDDERRDS
jgi:hypothetical protein